MPAKGNPTPPLVSGNSVREPILQGYVFQSGLHKPEVSSILTYKYPQYYLTSLFDRMNAEESIEQDIWSWFVQDRTREGSTVIAIDTALPAASVVLDTNFDFNGAQKGYLIVGDIIRLESGVNVRVTATQDNGANKQEITVVKSNGSNITATDLQAGDAFGHVSSAFPEASSAPEGRLYLPEEEYNVLQIIRRSFSISGTEFTNRTYINNGEAWYFEKEEIEMKELARDKELAIVFGQLSDTGVKETRGIISYIEQYGVNSGYAAATGVTEFDIQEHIKDLLKQNVSNDIVVLCGAQFLADAQRALADYQIQAEGKLAPGTAGLEFTSYKFMGKTVHFAYYEVFDDTAVVPTPVNGINSTTRSDFSNYSLWLDFGTDDNNRPLMVLKYKSHMGQSRKFIHTYVNGMMNPVGDNSGMAANGDDKFQINYLIECGLEFRLPNRSGILRATS